MLRATLLALMVLTTGLAGCLSPEDFRSSPDEGGFSESVLLVIPEERFSEFPYDVRNFTVIDPARMEPVDERFWSVYGTVNVGESDEHNYGGNCCEHYLATDQDGVIYNLGGEWPWWSTDRGLTWQEWVPAAVNTSPFCEQGQVDPTLDPGLGEGSVIQAPNGDIIAMGWFPYPSPDGADQFYAFLGEKSGPTEIAWSWCTNYIHEPFYDRSWQVPVIGPINPPPQYMTAQCSSGCPWASIVVSNLWSYSERGYQISVDGLNYDPIEIPDPDDSGPADIEFDFDFGTLGPEWNYMSPHREMRATPIPTGGALFPRWYSDGSNLFLDTNLQWQKHTLPDGAQLPAKNIVIDSSGAIHSIVCNHDDPNAKGCDGSKRLTHYMSTDGGYSWANYTHLWPEAVEGSNTFEWDFQADGELELAVISMRVQSVINETSGEEADVDLVYHIRDYRQSLAPDTVTRIGLGDLDSTSGAGNPIRFDFSSMGILPDGGVVVAYHDSTDGCGAGEGGPCDPMFAIELELPERYF